MILEMIPVGYMAKRVYKRPDWLQVDHVIDIFSVSGCVSEDFADYIGFWKHNGYWFFDSPEITSVITSKPANGDQVKTGQREWPGQSSFYSAESFGGKFVFVRQLRGPHLSTCP